MYNRLIMFFERNKKFEEEQHGFRPGRSVVTAAVCFLESVIRDIDNRKKVLAIFIDLAKAFDRVCHKKLKKALQNCGLQGISLNWIASYFENRWQYVELTKQNNNCIFKVKSKLAQIKYSVPQGSVLGPL